MDDIEWITSKEPVEYREAERFMEDRVAKIRQGDTPELIWFLEHPPLYTAGTSADPKDLLRSDQFPVHTTKRGGQYTYHGPGQRVIYVMLDLEKRGKDIRAFVQFLENWIISTLAQFDVNGVIRKGRVGVWVPKEHNRDLHFSQTAEDKIAAIGVRVRKWVTFHGVSINLSPDLEHFSGIVPCGISQFGVTSFQHLGLSTTMEQLDSMLRHTFEQSLAAQKP